LVIGGTGMFGSRLCDLLARDGLDVTVAGRGLNRGGKFCTNHAKVRQNFVQNRQNAPELPYITLDRDGPLDGLAGFDVIVDAAGPFHAYGGDPYRVARGAIAAGAHYFDLCDNADFCQGISVLDGEAKASCVTVASGMSSVPAVSSAAVTALCDGQTPLMIETAILPGNKAECGRSIVESILSQTGKFYVEKQGGRDVDVRSWSAPCSYDLGRYTRQGWRIEVPDQRLFPDHFNCPTVTFRAGLELAMMGYGLGVFSFIRSRLGFRIPHWVVSAVMFGARALAPFGTDRGAMIVQVTLSQGTGFIYKSWIMRAENGDGPYTPAVAIRAACRDFAALDSGAKPALSLIPLDKIEDCFADLDIDTDTSQQEIIPIFRQVLGPDFDHLPDTVKATHDAVAPRVFKGLANVTRGGGLQARIAALILRFPASADDIEVEVTKTPTLQGETWVRRFGTKTFQSHLRATQRGMIERFGPLTFQLDMQIQYGMLHFPVAKGWFWFIPIPRFMLPESIATEADIDGTFHFDVLLKSPTGATLVHYKGWLKRA
jgi:hypothetical protein